MSLRKSFAIGSVLALSPLLVVTSEVAPAHAACTGPSSYFVGGATSWSTTTRGVLGHIDVPSTMPTVSCSNGYTDVWDMVKDSNGNPFNDYAQIGFGVDYITSGTTTVTPRLLTFTQWTGNDGVPHTRIFPPPTGGTEHTYTEVYTAGHMEMRDNGTTKATTTFNPTSEWTDAWDGQYFNELAYPTSQAWGFLHDPVLYHSIQKHVNGNWVDFNTWANGYPRNDSPSQWSYVRYTPSDSTLGLKTWND